MAIAAGSAAAVVAQVRATKGTYSLRVLCVDGETRDVNVPPTRKKWEQLTSIIEGLEWMRIELRDTKKNTIGVIESGLDDLDDIDGDDEDRLDKRTIDMCGRLLKLMLSAQDVALKRDENKSAMLIESHVKLARVLTELVSSLAGLYGANLKTLQEANAANPEDELASMSFMRDLPSMMQAYAAIKQAQAASGPAGPTNGEK